MPHSRANEAGARLQLGHAGFQDGRLGRGGHVGAALRAVRGRGHRGAGRLHHAVGSIQGQHLATIERCRAHKTADRMSHTELAVQGPIRGSTVPTVRVMVRMRVRVLRQLGLHACAALPQDIQVGVGSRQRGSVLPGHHQRRCQLLLRLHLRTQHVHDAAVPE